MAEKLAVLRRGLDGELGTGTTIPTDRAEALIATIRADRDDD